MFRGREMEILFIILMGFLIIIANVIGFVFFKKGKNLYYVAFIILLLAAGFGGLGGALALLMIRDAFAVFYGLNLAYYLLINSLIVFLLALLVTIFQKYNSRKIDYENSTSLGVGSVFEKIKDTFTPKQLICTNCGRKIEEGESFTANITMPSEKNMPVSRLDNAIARTANSVLCERCQ